MAAKARRKKPATRRKTDPVASYRAKARTKSRQAQAKQKKQRRARLALLAGLVFVVAVGGGAVWLLMDRDEKDRAEVAETVAPSAPAPIPPTDAEEAPVQEDQIANLIEQLDPIPESSPKTTQEPAKTEKAWQRFAVAAPAAAAGRPKIAVVIDDVGLNASRAARVLNLPMPVTVAFLPYAKGLGAMVERAQQRGHEIMVHLPMEPMSKDVDPGPNALLTGLEPNELARRMDWNLARLNSYIGFNNHMGSRFTADRPGMEAVLKEAGERGLLFLDSRTTRNTVGRIVAERYGVAVLERDVFLDNVLEAQAIFAQLEKAEKIAEKTGSAIVIGHPHDVTLGVLESWAAKKKSV
ncbi:MAG: divergent polysaccharide deacetylase family protein, partial [Alphaproteobacteria bacterium]|nr:divergent polysaccharide deacetylase family protein [Alphaproteobacteria bacterium]